MTAHPTRDDLAAYALGALDSHEEKRVADHAESCAVCTDDLQNLAPAVAVLGESVEQFQAPPELRDRLMATVRDEAVSGVEESAAPRRRSRFAGLLMRPVTGLAVAAAIVAGVGGYLIAGGGDPAGDDATTVPITDATGDAGGELAIADDEATLTMHGMPQLSQGAVYQVWVADEEGTVTPSATFLPHEDGTATAAIPEADGPVSRVMVTAEPGPGRTEPSSPPVLDVQMG